MHPPPATHEAACCGAVRHSHANGPAHGVPSARAAPTPAVVSATYTCPMHPDVRRAGPGACPACGMALEPTAPLEAARSPADPDRLGLRAALSALLTLPMWVHMLGGLAGGHAMDAKVAWGWTQFALATPVVAWGGWPLLVRAATSISSRRLNMFTLIGLGVTAAYGFSVLALLAPGLLPPALQGAHAGMVLQFEAAASIVVLVLLGQWIEARARARAGDALAALLRQAPDRARRIDSSGRETDIEVAAVAVGDRLRVRAGEKVPVDGIVLEGETEVDESLATGESTPASKSAGSRVYASTINGDGAFVMRADRVGADTLLARIVSLVAAAQRTKAPIERAADRVAALFVPAVIAIALAAAAAWAAWGPEPRASHALVAAVSVLIVACPCALGLATPMSIMVAMGRAAGAGTLFRNAEALETLHRVDRLVVDKTGTLTEGTPSVVRVLRFAHLAEADVLALAAALEHSSHHPLGRAILAAAAERGAQPQAAADVHRHPGSGLSATVDGRRIAVGDAALMRSVGVAIEDRAAEFAAERNAGHTIVFVAVDGELMGAISIADRLRPSARGALRALREAGVGVVMASGDHAAAAAAVGAELGIAEVRAQVLPEQKAAFVAELQRAGHCVAVAGDGINDAPALAQADVGIAMAAGADVAVQTAAVTLVGGDLGGIVRARELSVATMRNIRQNLALAFAYNALAIPLAAGVAYPWTGQVVEPAFAAAAMSLSSVLVIANSLRLRRARLRPGATPSR